MEKNDILDKDDVKFDGENNMPLIEKAELSAEEVFKKLNCEIPVNPIKICELYGITVSEGDLVEDIDGVIVKEDGEWEIYIDKDQDIVKKRLTIAHELGHYFMHQVDAPDKARIIDFKISFQQKGLSKREEEANAFAAALLMNKEVVSRKWNEYHSIPVLASSFGVSNESMKYRLVNLGLIASAK